MKQTVNLLPEFRRIFIVTRLKQTCESPSRAHTEQSFSFSSLAQKPGSITVLSNPGQFSTNTDSLALFLEVVIQ